ncbi:MAG: hypothetical protein DRH15_01145 [Deltaproteobacteria bacterium]|nr:MAG: hypothetical protein DRH15_01145 [Deltaproteobacteria bacterium]
MKIQLITLVVCAITLATWPSASAQIQCGYGPSRVIIRQWRFHLSFHYVKCPVTQKASIIITKSFDIKCPGSGYLLFNGRLFSLKRFLNSISHRMYIIVNARKRNLFGVFLTGSPGAELTIEIRPHSVPH